MSVPNFFDSIHPIVMLIQIAYKIYCTSCGNHEHLNQTIPLHKRFHWITENFDLLVVLEGNSRDLKG